MRGRNAMTYELYLSVQAGAAMPDDPIVRKNLALVHWAHELIHNDRAETGLELAARPSGRVEVRERGKR